MIRKFSKKLVAILLCIAMLAVMPVWSSAAGTITVSDKYTICIGKSGELSEPAEYLNKYIKKIYGYTLPVSKTDSANKGYIALKIKPSLGSGYAITSDKKNITISGASLRNTVDRICAFLNRYGGVNYYTSQIMTKGKNIKVPYNDNYTYKPYFESTETDWYSPNDVDYSLFNGLSGMTYRETPAELGGGAEYISSFAHTYTNQFCNADKYFETDRKCFALSAGVRTKKSLCLSNPRTLEIVTSEVLDLLKEKHNSEAELQIISLTQNDNILFCTCPKCLAKYAEYGAISGLNLEFANSVAKSVKEAGYNNVAIDTFAYMYTRSAPKKIVPEDNVIIRLCSIECCFSHPLTDKHCSFNISFANDLKDWAKICDRLYVWDYTTNYCNFIGIFPNFNTLQANMQFFYENNVKGVYEEGNYCMSECDTEFGELRAYLICKLMQNPYCDLEAEREAFLKAYYGDGGKYIGDFIDIISENAATAHMSIYTSMRDTCNLTNKKIAECDALWQSAENASSGEALTHVKNSELAWRYWKYKNNESEFRNIITRKDMKEQFDEEMVSTNVGSLRECSETKAFFLAILQKVRFFVFDLLNPFFLLADAIKN